MLRLVVLCGFCYSLPSNPIPFLSVSYRRHLLFQIPIPESMLMVLVFLLPIMAAFAILILIKLYMKRASKSHSEAPQEVSVKDQGGGPGLLSRALDSFKSRFSSEAGSRVAGMVSDHARTLTEDAMKSTASDLVGRALEGAPEALSEEAKGQISRLGAEAGGMLGRKMSDKLGQKVGDVTTRATKKLLDETQDRISRSRAKSRETPIQDQREQSISRKVHSSSNERSPEATPASSSSEASEKTDCFPQTESVEQEETSVEMELNSTLSIPEKCYRCGQSLQNDTVAWISSGWIRCPRCGSKIATGQDD